MKGRSQFDFETISRRIRERRQKFGMSVQELADRAKVARYTVIRVESGHPCNPSTLTRLRKALALFSDQLFQPYEDGPFAVHRAKDQQWSVSTPKAEYQKRLIDDDPIHVNDDDERMRLGQLGFQPFFTSILGCELAGGVGGHALMELYRPSWVDQHYGEEFVYCLQGEAIISVDGNPCHLGPGDAVTFDAMKPHQYAPKAPVTPGDTVPRILIVVTLRPGEKIPRPESLINLTN